MPEVGLVKTGIKGLDSILLGGIPRNNVILVQGVTGSGKRLCWAWSLSIVGSSNMTSPA
jgi:KaiC/GvpD/RAD55 family RecA-like ATPase